MAKKRKGIWISEELIYDHKLDWTNKVLLTEIVSLSKLENGCIASNNHFAKLLGLKNADSASKRVTRLKNLGYIMIEIAELKKNAIMQNPMQLLFKNYFMIFIIKRRKKRKNN